MISAYLMGEPGVGKSALMEYVTRRWLGPAVPGKFEQFSYREYAGGVVVAGRDDELYPGTDTLSFTAVASAERYIAACSPPVFLAEGDRLANDRFFHWLRTTSDIFTVVHLVAPPGVLAERRAARGSAQSPAWLLGRQTKVENLAAVWSPLALDASASVVELAEQLVTSVPAFEALATVKR